MAIMYLSKESFMCPKELISLCLTVHKQNINYFENNKKPYVSSHVNSVDPGSTLFSMQNVSS